jgi:parallel beta-helix repeat protein
VEVFGNIISGNEIAKNKEFGVGIAESSDNIFYHNNFTDNPCQVTCGRRSINIWDDGYPSGGNYWSDYTGVDLFGGPYQNMTGGDGIGDTPYIIDANNQDRYPLMAPFSTFEAGVWDGTAYNVDVLSNSTVSDFKFDVDNKSISLKVTGDNGTVGFCRVAIPKSLLWADDGWTIFVDNQPITDYTKFEDENYTYLYFTYTHSTKTVTIKGTHVIPEYPINHNSNNLHAYDNSSSSRDKEKKVVHAKALNAVKTIFFLFKGAVGGFGILDVLGLFIQLEGHDLDVYCCWLLCWGYLDCWLCCEGYC